MRLIVGALLAILCLPVLAAGASEDLYSMELKQIGVDGKRRLLSVHEDPYRLALSPNQAQLAYVSGAPDGGLAKELKVADVRGSGERVLIRTPGGIYDLAWAPNGRTIALSVHPSREQANDGGVYLVQADGTELRRVAEHFATGLAWSPDSTRIAMSRRIDLRPPNLIAVLTVATGAVHDRATGERPRWSPDGKDLVFERLDAAGYGLYEIGVVPAEGGAVRTIVRGSAPSWSPDGRWVTFSASWGKRVSPALWIVSSRGGRPRLLVKWASNYLALWSPNGRWIAFARRREAEWLCGPRMKSTLGLVRPGNGKIRVLLETKRYVSPLAWSRDSRRLLYTSLLCPSY